MKNIEQVIESFSGTTLGDTLVTIYEYFNSSVDSFAFFQQKYNVHCPEGCGECCRHFLPDVTKSEALLVALYLRFCTDDWPETKRKLEFYINNDFKFCPLFRENTPYHCSVYQARPLICRLFGNSCNEDKDGNAVFKRCRFNYQPEIMAASLKFTDEVEKASVPIMENYGINMINLEGNSQETQDLPVAVLQAVEKLEYYARLIGLNLDESPSGTDGNDFPSPQAS